MAAGAAVHDVDRLVFPWIAAVAMDKEDTVKIEITQDDIERGVPRAADGCPLALALARQCPGVAGAMQVGRLGVRACRDDDSVMWELDLPGSLVEFVNDFDFGCLVKSGTYAFPGLGPDGPT
jgi:hypothetical protein